MMAAAAVHFNRSGAGVRQNRQAPKRMKVTLSPTMNRAMRRARCAAMSPTRGSSVVTLTPITRLLTVESAASATAAACGTVVIVGTRTDGFLVIGASAASALSTGTPDRGTLAAESRTSVSAAVV